MFPSLPSGRSLVNQSYSPRHVNHSPRHFNHSRAESQRFPEIESYGVTSGDRVPPLSLVNWQASYSYSRPSDEAYPRTYVSPRVNAYSLDAAPSPRTYRPSFHYACNDPGCSICLRSQEVANPLYGDPIRKRHQYDTTWRENLYGDRSTGRPHHQHWTYTQTDYSRPRYDTAYDLMHAPSAVDAIDWASRGQASLYNRLRDTRKTLNATVNQLRAFDNSYQSTYSDFDLGRPITPAMIPPPSR